MSKPGNNKGTKNFRNKLPEEEVIAIFKDTTSTQQELAIKHKVSQGTINHIKKKRTWAWLTGAISD